MGVMECGALERVGACRCKPGKTPAEPQPKCFTEGNEGNEGHKERTADRPNTRTGRRKILGSDGVGWGRIGSDFECIPMEDGRTSGLCETEEASAVCGLLHQF